MKSKTLSHYDASGSARMVDVGAKGETRRTARAHAFVRIKPSVLRKLPENPKGNPLEVARFAGIQAAKRTSELIPMCHPLMLSHVDVDVTVEPPVSRWRL
jgi:cyclic pyranopterin phosphate synthase